MSRTQFSRIMALSWQVQKKRNCNRSRSLLAAWAIFQNEDITVFHLVRKHSHEHYKNKAQPEMLTLFDR